MKIVISPAKSLDFETKLTTNIYSQSNFLKQSETIHKTLKKKKPKDLMELMHISENLANLNWQRNQEWSTPFTPENARQAVFAFNGDVYTGLDAYTIPTDKMDVLQDKLRILSGLYGVLKPLDLMQAYRLEMGISIPIGAKKNLYEFWKKTITKSLNEELNKEELFINLASNEYFKAIDTKALKVPVITANFKEFKNGQYKMISIFAKAARGMMARYIVDTNAKTIDDLKGFNYEGYNFSEPMSSEKELIFIR